jgi:GPH family glycoside/pentoside/hexuronide:cation symporter
LSLVGEIVASQKERSYLIASRLGLANFGSILGIAIPGYYLANGMEPYNPSSWLFSGLLIFTVCISVVSASLLKRMNQESLQTVVKSTVSHQQNSVAELFKQIIQDKKFLVILGAYFVANVAMSLNSSLALYYYRERLQLSESEVRNVLLIFLVFFTLSIPMWVQLGQKFSMIRSLNWGVFFLGVSSFLVYPFLPAGEAWAVYFFASFLGGFICGSSVLLEIYFTNEVKAKEAVKQEELLGSYLGIWKMTSKVSRGMTLVATGPIISWTVLNSLDSERFWLSIAFGPGVGLFFLLSCAVVYRYRKILSS